MSCPEKRYSPGQRSALGNIQRLKKQVDNNRRSLATDIQTLQQLIILGQIVALDVVEQFATAAGQSDQSTACVEILAVYAQVLGQVVDACGQQRDLDLTGASVLVVVAEIANDFLFIEIMRH